jgi:hypothetical protein
MTVPIFSTSRKFDGSTSGWRGTAVGSGFGRSVTVNTILLF